MNIIVFGATGDVGSRIVTEAVARSHKVTAVVREKTKPGVFPEGVEIRVTDATDTASVAQAMAGHDLAITALRPPQGREGELVGLTRSILKAADSVNIRVIVSGGAARLRLPNGSPHTVLTDPDFLPDDVVPIARASQAQAELCASMPSVDCTYASPSAMLTPGTRKGKFRLGTDTLIVDEDGNSAISMEDFAVAIVDEAASAAHSRSAFTAGY